MIYTDIASRFAIKTKRNTLFYRLKFTNSQIVTFSKYAVTSNAKLFGERRITSTQY